MLGEPDLALIRQWLDQNPGWSRWRLSQALATHWDWRNGVGQLKDMAARTLLLKLHQRGFIALPPRRQLPTNRMRCRSQLPVAGEGADRPLDCTLAQLGALTLHEVSAQAAERAWVRAALGRHHYLGFGGAVGENLQIRGARRPRTAAGLSGFWRGRLESVRLATSLSAGRSHSKNQSGAAGQQHPVSDFTFGPGSAPGQLVAGPGEPAVSGHWQAKYGHPIPAVLETFVERERFGGTAYRAANWLAVGRTTGRTRQDRHTCIQAPIKDLYLYPLRRGLSGGAGGMKRGREELQREFAGAPPQLLD